MFELQDYLSREVSDKLRLRLTPEDKERLTRRYTNDTAAYQLYLQGRYHRNKMSPEGYRKSIEYMNQAVAKDPRFAMAYAGLAEAHNQMSFFNLQPPRDEMPKAKEAAARALAIDPGLAEAHISLGWASFTYDWTGLPRRVTSSRHAPSTRRRWTTIPAISSTSRWQDGRTRRFGSEGRRWLATLYRRRWTMSSCSTSPRPRNDEALAECRRTIELDPGFAVAYEVMAATSQPGRVCRGPAAGGEGGALNPFNDYSAALVGFLHAHLGDRQEAIRVAERLEAKAKQRYTPAISIALVYAGLGDHDRAFQWLDQAYDERSNRLAYLGREPVWESLRSDPRFAALLARIGLPK